MPGYAEDGDDHHVALADRIADQPNSAIVSWCRDRYSEPSLIAAENPIRDTSAISGRYSPSAGPVRLLVPNPQQRLALQMHVPSHG
jgi:hypothetical protein